MKKIFYLLLLSFSISVASCGDDSIEQESKCKAVDLGLSVKWATCNVGATSPEEFGDYFAWGETSPKEVYNIGTYKHCNGTATTITKYCTSNEYGTMDNKTVLDPADDAAIANWGEDWHTPTRAEFDELCTNCTWTWTAQNGVNGYKVTGKNGNSIFLPAAGNRSDSDLIGTSCGYYWSSTIDSKYLYNPDGMSFSEVNFSSHPNLRYLGYSVRPVCP